jgi:hypothetical protein
MEYKARLRGLWRIISSKTIISVMVIVVTVGCSTFGKTESTAQRVGHRSGAAFAADDARASRSNASRFAAHMFEVLCALCVSVVRFCGEVTIVDERSARWLPALSQQPAAPVEHRSVSVYAAAMPCPLC